MTTTSSAVVATPSEQLFFDGAHLAHVVAYYDELRLRRIERDCHRFRSVRRISNLAVR